MDNHMTGLRELTPEESARAERLFPEMHLRLYGEWIDSGFTPDEIDEWYPLTSHQTMRPRSAMRLRAVGVSPQEFRHAATLVMGQHSIGIPVGPDSASSYRRGAILWHAVSGYVLALASTATWALQENLKWAQHHGVTLSELGSDIGVSKQYISKLINRPMDYVTPVERDGKEIRRPRRLGSRTR